MRGRPGMGPRSACRTAARDAGRIKEVSMPAPRFCLHCGAPMAEREVDGEPRLACTACPFVHFDNPVAVAGVIIRRDDEVLLVRPPRGSHHILVSGFLEAYESVEDAAVREVQEETGLEVTIER